MRVAISGGSSIDTAGYEALRDAEKECDAAERIRLLYVATTRARDHLVVSLHHKSGSGSCYAALLSPHTATAPAEAIEVEVPPPAATLGVATSHAAEPAEEPLTPDALGAWLEQHRRDLGRAGRPSALAATFLAETARAQQHAEEPPDPGLDKGETDADGDDRPAWRRGRSATAIGRAVHATLQTVDLATGAGLAETARAQALAEGIPDREAEVRALARGVLGAPVVRAAAGLRHWREVPVAAEVDGRVVEGFIDLLVEEAESDGGLVVVDYKTDRARGDDEIDRAVERYSLQGATYALALEQTLGRPVTRCVFVFARPGAAVERDLPDLRGAIERVRALAAIL